MIRWILNTVCDRISGSGSGSGQSGQYFPIRFRFRFRPNFGRIGRILKNNSKVFQNAKNVAVLVFGVVKHLNSLLALTTVLKLIMHIISLFSVYSIYFDDNSARPEVIDHMSCEL